MNEQQADALDLSRQVVECGAAVLLNDTVIKHGLCFVHPELPLFKLFLQIDHKRKKIAKYHFEMVKPHSAIIKSFVIQVMEPDHKVEIIKPDGAPLNGNS